MMNQSAPQQYLPGDDAEGHVELTDEELARSEQEIEEHWKAINEELSRRAHTTYSVADPTDLARCVREHMNIVARHEMMAADAYHCPGCGRLLKDRRTPLATALLAERKRLRDLWTLVEEAPAGEERQMALRRFKLAMGEPS